MREFEALPEFESMEAQVRANGIMVEIANLVPRKEVINYCAVDHALVSWIFPRPVRAQAWFGPSGEPPQLFDLGNLAFIPSGVQTLWHFRQAVGPRRMMVVRFAPEMFDCLEEEYSIRCDLWSMASYNICEPDILYAVQHLAKETLEPSFAGTALIESLGTGLLVRLVRYFQTTRQEGLPAKGGLAPWQMRRITERIADVSAVDSIPSLVELASLVGISTGHLRRAFKHSAGCTLTEHIRKIRLKRACALLSGTDMALKEIAMQLGFSAQYGFTAAFQRDTGETPSAFRKRTRASIRLS